MSKVKTPKHRQAAHRPVPAAPPVAASEQAEADAADKLDRQPAATIHRRPILLGISIALFVLWTIFLAGLAIWVNR